MSERRELLKGLTPTAGSAAEELAGLAVPEEDLEALPFADLGRRSLRVEGFLGLVGHAGSEPGTEEGLCRRG